MRKSLALRAWEAVTPERDLKGVLAAVSEVLLPAVHFDGVGIIIFAREDRRRLYVLHLTGLSPQPGENEGRAVRRLMEAAKTGLLLSRPKRSYSQPRLGTSPGSDDLLAEPDWYPHEFRMAGAGIRAYRSIPLVVRGERVGVAVFGRNKPIAFTVDQIEVLNEVSRALAVAVSNSLAYEEIRRLRDQLATENIALKEQLGQTPWDGDIIGNSEALRRVIEAVEQVAATEATVLLTGETGTGKELIARAIHQHSRRLQGPLVKVNCSAIPNTLLASELFGHERGAFTGAHERRLGRFEQAQGGTLFLDEIGELTPEMQVLLLRVLKEREIERLGGRETVRVDVRVIAASNRNLAGDVREGRFREDLFYRLNVFPIAIPPLRDRAGDIPLLAAHFAAKHGKRHGREIERIDRRTMSLFENYHWPGNVRELENLVERAVITSRGGTLRLPRGAFAIQERPIQLNEQLRGQERESIEMALRQARGRISGPKGAARALGMPASTLESKLKRLGIDKYNFRN